MAVEMSGRYLGGMKVEITHGPSGTVWKTAAPVDNNGDGSSFSPTDMVAVALGACAVTMIAIAGERDGIDLSGVRFRLEKHMHAEPRRLGRIPIRLEMPAGLDAAQRRKYERIALTCPVHRSLIPEVERAIEFVYPD